MKIHHSAEVLISMLVSITIGTIIFFVFNRWQSYHLEQQSLLYQKHQALQIANNQISRLMAGMACERSIYQNHLRFIIRCDRNSVVVKYPQGEINLNNNKN